MRAVSMIRSVRPALAVVIPAGDRGGMVVSGSPAPRAASTGGASWLRVALEPDGRWAVTAIWLVVNAVNVLQAIGFATRPFAPWVNPALGLIISAYAIPATLALVRLISLRSGPLLVAGPLVFVLFVAFHVLVEYVLRISWRQPVLVEVQLPYLMLFFGSILLMGLPMFWIDRRRWLVTVLTTALLLAAMVYALAMGVG
jgi:hypothetical protein